MSRGRRDPAARVLEVLAWEDEKVEGKLDQAGGKVKEGVGNATGDESLEREGRTDQAKGDVKEGVGKAKDAIKDLGR